MIIGFGTDLIEIKRVEKILQRYEHRFLQKFFTSEEHFLKSNLNQKPAHYAKRFAAKEACVKALGYGFANSISGRHIQITNNNRGRPILTMTGRAKEILDKITPKHHKAITHLTISDERSYAQASVVIEAIRIEQE